MRMGAESPVLSFLGFARSTLDARIYSFTRARLPDRLQFGKSGGARRARRSVERGLSDPRPVQVRRGRLRRTRGNEDSQHQDHEDYALHGQHCHRQNDCPL
jgi:hypothetical protein